MGVTARVGGIGFGRRAAAVCLGVAGRGAGAAELGVRIVDARVDHGYVDAGTGDAQAGDRTGADQAGRFGEVEPVVPDAAHAHDAAHAAQAVELAGVDRNAQSGRGMGEAAVDRAAQRLDLGHQLVLRGADLGHVRYPLPVAPVPSDDG